MKKQTLLPLAIIALLTSCSSTDSVTNPEAPVKLEARLVRKPECKNDAFVREASSETNESRKRTDGEGEYEFVQPVESFSFSYVDGDSLKIQHNNLSEICGTNIRAHVLFEKETNTIRFVETFELGENFSKCKCIYDVDSNVGKLVPGKYKVLVRRVSRIMSEPWMPSPIDDLPPIFETEIEFKQGLNVSYEVGK